MTDVDEIAVERLVSGEWAYHRQAERREAVRILTERDICRVTPRQVFRDRAYLRSEQ